MPAKNNQEVFATSLPVPRPPQIDMFIFILKSINIGKSFLTSVVFLMLNKALSISKLK